MFMEEEINVKEAILIVRKYPRYSKSFFWIELPFGYQVYGSHREEFAFDCFKKSEMGVWITTLSKKQWSTELQ